MAFDEPKNDRSRIVGAKRFQYIEKLDIEKLGIYRQLCMAMQTITFDSADLPGDERLRKERWVDSLSSGYVRLLAEAPRDVPFDGQLRILLLGHTTIGRISGTVQTIARTKAEIAAENTDNAVLLVNGGDPHMAVEQNGKSVTCGAGAAVLIEQCKPSVIRVRPEHACNFVAIQLPRDQIRRQNRHLESRFMQEIPASSSTLGLARVYTDALLGHSLMQAPHIPRFAADHVGDMVAAIVDPESSRVLEQAPSLRATRFGEIQRELDRNYIVPGFSLTALARRLGVSPRYVQALLAEAETSFTDELTERRLGRAYEMLASPRFAHLNIMDVAHECGFPTVSHFHRVFRRQFNATPGQVRDKARL